jgi:hypothetical protein
VATARVIAIFIRLADRSRRLGGAAGISLGVVLAAAACSGSSQPTATLAIPSGALVLRAVNTTFQPVEQAAPAGQTFTL